MMIIAVINRRFPSVPFKISSTCCALAVWRGHRLGTINISCASGGGCNQTCPAGGSLENESNCGLPSDYFNGGCNSAPPVLPTFIASRPTADRGRQWNDAGYGLVCAYSVFADQLTWDVVADFNVATYIITPALIAQT